MADNLLEIAQILSRRFNPWWNGVKLAVPEFKRRDFAYLKKELENTKVITLIGPRQVGKTTLIKQLISELLNSGKNPKRILYLELDDVQLRDLSPKPLLDVLKAYELHILSEALDLAKEPTYLFLDEVQRVENWAETVKTFHDNNPNLHFVCTGSASFTISQQSSETLPGRQLAFTMFPLKFADAAVIANRETLNQETVRNWSYSLREALFKAWKENEPSIFMEKASKVMLETQQTALPGYFNQYMLRGGYPEIVLTSEPSRIQNLFKGYAYDVILKDLMPWFKIRDFGTAEHLLFLLASNSGSELGYKSFLERLRGSNYPTVKSYIKFFEQLNIITLVNGFSKSTLGSDRNAKVYFNDVGFRNAMIGLEKPLPQEYGALAETVLHDHLQRLSFKFNNSITKQVFYYKTKKAEIDFVIHSTQLNKNLPIECKYGQDLTKNQAELLNTLAEENKTFGIKTTTNTLAQKRNTLEIPIWIMAMMA